MSQQHLSVGSEEPPKAEDGKLRLYSMEYCPFAQRARLILLVKNVPHDIVNIDLMKKPEWYLKIHPEGKVPALNTGNEIIIESLDICNWLEEKYPENSLYPTSPEAKQADIDLIKKIPDILSVFYECVLNPSSKAPKEWGELLTPALNVFEEGLIIRNTPFFGGSKPSMVDYMLWPWAERAGVVGLALKEIPFEESEFSNLKKWRKLMKQDPVCAKIYHGPEPYWKIIQKKTNNEPIDYDNV